MAVKKCCYILRMAAPGVTPIYCHKPTRYVMVKDDDRNKVRQYDPFCPEHREIVNREDANLEDE